MRRALFAWAVALAIAAIPAWGEKAPVPDANATEEIAAARLPPEARETIARIRAGGPFAYAKDGAIFGNREGNLPRQKRGYYREYTVKTPGVRTRGARRIVAGEKGELYYTDDHYSQLRRIRE